MNSPSMSPIAVRSAASRSALPKTSAPSALRSIAPLAAVTCSPNWATIRPCASVPGSYIAWT